MRLTPTRLPGTPGISLGPRVRMQANPPFLSHVAAVPIVTAARWRLGCRGDVPLRRTSARRLPFDLLVMGWRCRDACPRPRVFAGQRPVGLVCAGAGL